ncbi:MAG: PfkB family carbohydrate kinase [Chitinophagaceae bacterium]
METHQPGILCFGEVLWDIFPSGARMGGAPLNVCYHLNRLGSTASMISRVGSDEYGQGIMDFLFHHQMSQEFIQRDATHPTGKVYANTQNKTAVSYDILRDVAWDFIEWQPEFPLLARKDQYLVFGSLATRNEVSAKTLHRLLKLDFIKVLDVNLRTPYYSRDSIINLLENAHIVKMNEEELGMICDWLDIEGDDQGRMKGLKNRFPMNQLLVTMGERGACYLDNEQFFSQLASQVKVVDTVGSGDAFLAAFLTQMIRGSNPRKALQAACFLGGWVAGREGGCPAYHAGELTPFF